MQSTQLDPLDAQDLALTIYARWVFDVPPEELGELADAVLVWADDSELEEILSRAVARCWGPTLEDDLRECLNELVTLTPSCGHRARSALADLDARHGASELARAFMLQCATQYAHDGLPFMLCLCCLEEGLAVVDPDERRTIALRAACVAVRDVDVEEDEIARIVRACTLRPGELPRLLATDARRDAMRQRLRRIAALGVRSLPLLSQELRAALWQSSEASPADDELWRSLCVELARGIAAPELN